MLCGLCYVGENLQMDNIDPTYKKHAIKTMQAVKRLMEDIMNRPIEDLVLSTRPVHGARYYCVEPVGGNWLEMEQWCITTFGDPGDIWETSDFVWPEAARWLKNNRKFWFRNEADRTMFIMKWL